MKTKVKAKVKNGKLSQFNVTNTMENNVFPFNELIPQNEFAGALFTQALKSHKPFCEPNVDLNNLTQLHDAALKYSKLSPDRVKRDGKLLLQNQLILFFLTFYD